MVTQKRPDSDDAELETLRAEVTRLRAEPDAVAAAPPEPPTNYARPKRGRTVGRVIAAVALILVGVLLIPITMVAAWAATEVSDTNRFVASLAPLSHDPEVRDYIGTVVVKAIEKRVDIPTLTKDAFSGLADLGLPPRASAALQALSPAATAGLESLLTTAVHRVINSSQFQSAWDKTLRLSHNQLDDILNNNKSAAVVIGDNGAVGIHLAPVIAKVKSQLEAANFPLADKIPAINITITVGTVKEITPLRNAYQALLVLVAILPWLAIILIAAGILISPRRPLAVMWSGAGLAFFVLLLLAALGVGRTVLASRAASTRGVPQGVTYAIVDALTAQVWASGIAIVIIGLILIVAGFLAGATRAATTVRAASTRGVTRLQAFLLSHRLWNPRLGFALRSARVVVWVVVIGVALAILYLSEPLTAGAVVATAVVAACVLILYSLFASPSGAERIASTPDGGATLSS